MKKRRAFLKTFLGSFELNPNSEESFRSEIYHYSYNCSAFALGGLCKISAVYAHSKECATHWSWNIRGYFITLKFIVVD